MYFAVYLVHIYARILMYSWKANAKWTESANKESRKRRIEKEGRKNEKMRAKEKDKSEFIGLVYK